ncbi:hypothetical protein CALVIDRAFT_79612 [Calocera viscosa TUFC12733]|uniref:Uncharacterized protein n=1 Tax=Calocera viscosa (strain TUFC12733) TaxID=1330018 RepID=A0A167N0M9_CALVF|nr:hypothetical protein CALVIDRAFT_79612 [Calocera viscosa TUFC12733]
MWSPSGEKGLDTGCASFFGWRQSESPAPLKFSPSPGPTTTPQLRSYHPCPPRCAKRGHGRNRLPPKLKADRPNRRQQATPAATGLV